MQQPAAAPKLRWPYHPSNEPLRLGPGELHVWCAVLSIIAPQLPQLETTLSVDERNRADRFRAAADRTSYVLRRAILRLLLGRYLRHPAEGVRFSSGPRGKPYLADDFPGGSVHFSASHSADLAVYAFTFACPIGVDVELLRSVPHWHDISCNFFSPRETRELADLPEKARPEAFLACWTRKEAVLKASGVGIGEGVAHIEVSIAAEEPVAVREVAGDAHAAREWSLLSLSPASSYLGAVAFRHPPLLLKAWSFPHQDFAAPDSAIDKKPLRFQRAKRSFMELRG